MNKQLLNNNLMRPMFVEDVIRVLRVAKWEFNKLGMYIFVVKNLPCQRMNLY
jgi:GTP cyclohydrolase FolE2